MSDSKTNREQAIRAVTDEILVSKYTSEAGSKAKVERSEIENEYMDQLREVLGDMGRNLSECGVAPKGMTYVGSLSVHVYKAEALKTAAFATLTNLGTMDGALADGALRELTGSTMVMFGRARKKLRSGL